ncbi:MAG: glucose-1-phosphate thymidylyltransferase [Elusimicrobia bacterium RIFCSPLOWO2_01_FULL_54_10]|nr:MAG: glucose-1-phosphate thymidylyltransferase [Elusimicrobia bacterium RIFCSPLOWO2_01_FULL_54_10]
MKALVLSGGKGTRLRPITHTSAKQLVPIANKPILFYGLEAIARCGIREVGIVVGETQAEIRAAVSDGKKWGIQVTYIPQSAPLGLAHAVKISEPFLKRDDFVMYLGDNLLRDGIESFVGEFKKKKPNALILLTKVAHPEQFGVAELSNGIVKRLEEKPKKPKSDMALVGVYMFDSNIFKAVKAIQPSGRGELEITDAIQYLIDKKFKVMPHTVSGWWKDTGRLEDLLEANGLVLMSAKSRNDGAVDAESDLEGTVIIEKGAKVSKSRIRGPAIIGERAEISNSYVGPNTSIYHDTRLKNCGIEHSIVLENSVIENVELIEGSLIGQNAVVRQSPAKPSAYRIMIGDSSRVEIP